MLTLLPPPPPPEAPLPRRLVTVDPGHTGIIVGPHPGCVRMARRWILQSAHATPSLGQDIAAAADELVTNALRHSRSGLPGGRTSVELFHHAGALVLRVSDQGPLDPNTPGPRRLHVDFEAESGRGLALVEHLAHRWSCLTATAGPTVVTALFTTHPPKGCI